MLIGPGLIHPLRLRHLEEAEAEKLGQHSLFDDKQINFIDYGSIDVIFLQYGKRNYRDPKTGRFISEAEVEQRFLNKSDYYL
jgi:hypothetical protein